jgi:hypothetical protein
MENIAHKKGKSKALWLQVERIRFRAMVDPKNRTSDSLQTLTPVRVILPDLGFASR